VRFAYQQTLDNLSQAHYGLVQAEQGGLQPSPLLATASHLKTFRPAVVAGNFRMEQLSFVLDRLSSTPAPAALSFQNLLSLHELLISSDKEEDRRYVADAVYALFLMKTGQYASPVVAATRANPRQSQLKRQGYKKARKPYTTERKIKKIFQEQHQELYKLFCAQQIPVAKLLEWYEERYELLPGDRELVNFRVRFYKTFHHALEHSPVFYRGFESERGYWKVSSLGA
jgi:hypothetical protein